VRVVDATFPIDVLKGLQGAVEKAREMEEGGDLVGIPASAVAEVLVGAYFKGGALLERTVALLNQFEVLPADQAVAYEAGRLGAAMRRRGYRMAAADLLVAATCTAAHHHLVSRDGAFGRVPGLTVEQY